MSTERPEGASTRLRRKRLAACTLVGLGLVTGAVWVFALWDMVPALPGFELSVEAIEDRIHSWGVWGAAGSIFLMILHSFIPFPAEFLAMANGMVYGPLWGTVITWTGAMLGAYVAFGLARWLGRPFVLVMVAERHRVMVDRWTAQQGGGVLLFSRFVPVISFNLINYAAGLTPISWWTFTWATGLGILPLTFLMVLMGDGMWSGETNAWLWLIGAAVAGWLLWRVVIEKSRRSEE
ncbi:MAG: TVP38/TMEM64 family protein [Candidatus Binatia bacterium]